jgi:DNA-binding CsgD family transcriptional regulator
VAGFADIALEDSAAAIFQSTVRLARRSLGLRAAFVATATEDTPSSGDSRTITERDGLRHPGWGEVVIRPGRGLGGRVMRELRPMMVADYLQDSTITGDYRPIVQAEGIRAAACIPMIMDGRLEALLYVAAYEAGGLGSRVIDTAAQIADLALEGLRQSRARAALAAQARHALRLGDQESLLAVAQLAADLPASSSTHGLTRREFDVLDLLATGASDADIAQTLVISKATAKEHVCNIRRKLDARSRLEAVARARTAGLV